MNSYVFFAIVGAVSNIPGDFRGISYIIIVWLALLADLQYIFFGSLSKHNTLQTLYKLPYPVLYFFSGLDSLTTNYHFITFLGVTANPHFWAGQIR